LRRGVTIRYPLKQTVQWLSWLARQMTGHNQTEFYLERMQPDWLPDARSHLVYRVILCLVNMLALGPIFGLVFGLRTKIEPAEVHNWSWQRVRKQWYSSLVFGLLLISIVGWARILIMLWRSAEREREQLIGGIVNGLVFLGLLVGLVFVPLLVPLL